MIAPGIFLIDRPEIIRKPIAARRVSILVKSVSAIGVAEQVLELQNTGTAGNYEKFSNRQISQLKKLILELQNKYLSLIHISEPTRPY